MGSWQRPSRRSVSQKPKDRRSRSQPEGGTGAAGLTQAWPPSCSLAAAIPGSGLLPAPDLVPSASDGPQLLSRGSRKAAVSPGPGRPPGPAEGTGQQAGSPTPASGSSSKLHICRCVCCSHGDLRQLFTLLGGGPASLLCQCPQLHRQTDVPCCSCLTTVTSYPGVSRPSDVLPHRPTSHQNILGTPGSQQRPSHLLAGSSLALTWHSQLMAQPPDHPANPTLSPTWDHRCPTSQRP